MNGDSVVLIRIALMAKNAVLLFMFVSNSWGLHWIAFSNRATVTLLMSLIYFYLLMSLSVFNYSYILDTYPLSNIYCKYISQLPIVLWISKGVVLFCWLSSFDCFLCCEEVLRFIQPICQSLRLFPELLDSFPSLALLLTWSLYAFL